jgi:hypothetical protein
MSNAIADLNLSVGVRCVVGKELRREITAKELSVETLAQSPGEGASLASQTVAAALIATRTTAAITALFYFLTVITLGIYLLWTLSLLRYITADRGSFYNAALASLEDLANPPQPPKPEPTPPADEGGEILQLETEVEAKEVKDSLEIICKRIFKSINSAPFFKGSEDIIANSVCAVFKKFSKGMGVAIADACMPTSANWESVGLSALVKALKIKGWGVSVLKFRKGVSKEEWSLFISKLIQFSYYAEGQEKEEGFCKGRNKFISENLEGNFRIAGQREAVVHVAARKVWKAFLEALHAVASEPPLNEFLVARRSVDCDECVFQFVCKRVLSYLEQLTKELATSTAQSPQLCLKLVRQAGIGSYNTRKVEKTRVKLALGENKAKFNERKFVDALNPLLAKLDATVGKALAETTFDVALEFDGQGKPKKSEKMTLIEYFDAKAKEWNEMIDSTTGKSNGALLAEAESATEGPRAEFLDTAEIEKLPLSVESLSSDSDSESYYDSDSDKGDADPPLDPVLFSSASSYDSSSPRVAPRPPDPAPKASSSSDSD